MEKLAFDRRESAELLSISLRTLDSLLSRKELRSRRVGRRVLITREELERFLKRGRHVEGEPRQFSTWCAKAIALIGRLPGTLADRAIEVQMRRRMAGEKVERLRQDRIESECEHLRRQAVRWKLDFIELLKQADPMIPAGLNDRAGDCYRPLLAIADAAGGAWPERAKQNSTLWSCIATIDSRAVSDSL